VLEVFRSYVWHSRELAGIVGVSVGLGRAVMVAAASVPPADFVAKIAVSVEVFLGALATCVSASAVRANNLVR